MTANEYREFHCSRCNKLIYETDSDYNWFKAFKKCKLCANREGKR